MRCVHINIRKAIFVLLSVLINTVQHSQIENSVEMPSHKTEEKSVVQRDVELNCPLNAECNELHYQCLDCDLNFNCIYGNITSARCRPKSIVKCNGITNFTRSYVCRYCYQTEPWEHSCELKANCNSVATPKAYYRTNCTVRSDILCLGNRTFYKNVRCNWTGGYRWSTALALSITLGGFGADRFYLGHWQEGIGKLFSFGGLGVWTLIDVILISLHYLGPADGSLYI